MALNWMGFIPFTRAIYFTKSTLLGCRPTTNLLRKEAFTHPKTTAVRKHSLGEASTWLMKSATNEEEGLLLKGNTALQ